MIGSRSALAAAVAALVAWLAITAAASAATRGCADDAARLCPGVTREKGALLACLKPHAAELSAGCRATIERLEKKQNAMVRRRPQVNTVRSALRTPSPVPTAKPTPAT